ncbi:EpsG family protein [Flavobacterium anhuiense]|uniref:EpsG family protein n=1 Tax=Flavobacterium anhuiense TaxID=459526 RepID=A0ABY0LZR7_9FLAO|nr:EpsG family protein [Flavobacterium anhuiense]SCY84869.1 EpsG family protein [Flavobacterium anhuiense]
MIAYIIPFLVTIVAAIVFDICKYKNNAEFLVWMGLYIYLSGLIGLRYMVGGDSYFYMLYFNNISTNNILDFSWDSEYQPLFTILNSLAKAIYSSFTTFQIFHVLIINSCLFYYIWKNSKLRFSVLFLCLLMFYINFTVEILRESLAIMVFIINYKNLENNKWIRYYIGVFIAIMFHLSAVFLIVLPFLKFLRINRHYILLLIVILLALNQLNYLFTFFENIDKINKKVNDYSEASYGWKSTFLFFATRTLIPIGLFYWAKNKFNIVIKYEYLICVFGLLGVCSIFNTIIFTRFTNYLMLFYCITLADVMIPFFRQKIITSSKLFVITTFVFILFTSGYMSFYWPAGYYVKWIPYYSVFSYESESNKFIDRDY